MHHCDLLSDLHLHPERPELIQIFLDYLQGPAHTAQSVYLLGDIFEYWLGDDAGLVVYAPLIEALRALSLAQVAVFFQHGNRDFLVKQDFAAATGATLLSPEYCVTLGGIPTLLMHGDSLCTDDVEHQKFRAVALDSAVQQRILSLPLAQREQIAQSLRLNSKEVKRYKPQDIMDVNQDAVLSVMRQHAVRRLIHGHTHRPHTHQFQLDGHNAERIVLADWREQGHVLRLDSSGSAQALQLP